MAEIEESKITDITGGSELDKKDARAKAAVVVVSLGADRASQIYKYLSEQEIEDLTYEVAKLGKTNNAQVENALDEFYKMCLTHKMMTDGGLDYARSVLEKAFGETTARNLLEKVSKTLQSKPFNFFTKGDPKSLLALLQHERPQVIALIMAYMDPQQAAQILEQLPNEKRIPVLEGMANMSRVSPEAIAIVEEEMKRKFATIITSEDNMNLGGIDYVADVMKKHQGQDVHVREYHRYGSKVCTAFYQGLRFQGYCICIKDCIRGYEERILCKYVQAYGRNSQGRPGDHYQCKA